MNIEAIGTQRSTEWSTPQDFYDRLDAEFHFDLDPCGTEENHKCRNFFTKEQDGLTQNWGGHRVFCNPPYGRNVDRWVRKCAEEAEADPSTLIVLLVFARTDTRWFHDWLYQKPNVELRFIRGRLKFGNAKAPAPFPSMLAIFNGGTVKSG